MKEEGLDGFDFLVMAFLNIGFFSWPGHKVLECPELHIRPNSIVSQTNGFETTIPKNPGGAEKSV